MADVYVWIKNDTVLVNLSAIAYIRFGDEPDSKVEYQPGIVFRVSDGQKEEIIPLEKEEAQRPKELLRQEFRLGLVKQR